MQQVSNMATCLKCNSSLTGSSSRMRQSPLHPPAGPHPHRPHQLLSCSDLLTIQILSQVCVASFWKPSNLGHVECCCISESRQHLTHGRVQNIEYNLAQYMRDSLCYNQHSICLCTQCRSLCIRPIVMSHSFCRKSSRTLTCLPQPALYVAADYHIQFCDQMGLRTWSLATLRQDMRCGKGDVLPNTPILTKADGYWLPLREVCTLHHFLLPSYCVIF